METINASPSARRRRFIDWVTVELLTPDRKLAKVAKYFNSIFALIRQFELNSNYCGWMPMIDGIVIFCGLLPGTVVFSPLRPETKFSAESTSSLKIAHGSNDREHRPNSFGGSMESAHGSGAETIRVLVVDDTRIHTQLLAEALRRDRELEVFSPPARSRELAEAIRQHRVTIVVLSCSLEEEPLRGFELLRELRASDPGILAIMLLDSSKREAVLRAFRAGARGICSRHDSLETLTKCIRSVCAGQIWANSEQLSFAVEALAASPVVRAVDSNGLSLLSKREMDVVRSLAEGLTNREIAARLGLSQHTIKNYLFRVYDKLGVSSRLELLFMTLTQAGSPQPTAEWGTPGSSDLAGQNLAKSGRNEKAPRKRLDGRVEESDLRMGVASSLDSKVLRLDNRSEKSGADRPGSATTFGSDPLD